MNSLKPSISILVMSLSFFLMGCLDNTESSRTRLLFETRTEAEKAAKDLNCTGAHQMGNKWMPCKSHDDHGKMEKHGGHHHHH